jgi:hypothetical protein
MLMIMFVTYRPPAYPAVDGAVPQSLLGRGIAARGLLALPQRVIIIAKLCGNALHPQTPDTALRNLATGSTATPMEALNAAILINPVLDCSAALKERADDCLFADFHG